MNRTGATMESRSSLAGTRTSRFGMSGSEQFPGRGLKAALLQSRFILLAGFRRAAAADGLRRRRQHGHAAPDSEQQRRQSARTFSARTRLLEKIRSDVYLSGTYVRDYLLEPEPVKPRATAQPAAAAQRHRCRAAEISGPAARRKRSPFRGLTKELTAYWKVLEPVFQWNAAQRRAHGYAFLRDEVFPRRMAMLGIADQIARHQRIAVERGQAAW